MATDDISIRVGRLELESTKAFKVIKEDNPFHSVLQKQNKVTNISLPSKCVCHVQSKRYGVEKRKQSKILRDPILKLPQCSMKNKKSQYHKINMHKLSKKHLNAKDNIYLHSLVDTCEQLYISLETNKSNIKVGGVKNNKCWQNSQSSNDKHKEPIIEKSASSSCSQQALNPPCDVTIDELASYFETLVHIPKKMSSMAEMMYI